MKNQTLLNINQASELLQIHQQTLRKLVKKGEITAYIIGNKHMFTMADLINYVKKNKI